MRKNEELKRERVHLRLNAKIKGKLERAATYEGTSVSDFVLKSALTAAEGVIERHEQVTLSGPDWDVFYDALLNSPEPNETLKRAASRYRKRVGG